MAPTKRNLRIQLILVFSCLLIIAMPFFPFLEGPELSTYDLRFKLRPPAPVSGEIVIIEISDDTLNNLGKWPLPRDFHASLINVLKEFGVKSIVFDILFSEPTEHDDVFSEGRQYGKRGTSICRLLSTCRLFLRGGVIQP